MINDTQKKSDYIFNSGSLNHFRDNFRKQQRRLAFQLKNLRIKRISFRTLRHFKATMEYHRTKDIMHVMNVLGHKNIKNTLVYTHLVDWKDDEYVSKIAKTGIDASKLVEAGFEYVCTTPDSLMVFRKRK